MAYAIVSAIVFFCLQLASGKQLPPAIKRCSRTDPNFSKCAIDNGNAAIPSLLAGVKEFNVPPLNPLVVPFVEIEGGSSLNMKFRNIKAVGIDSSKIQDLKIDFKNRHIEIKIHMDKLEMTGDYELSGRILVLPINGKGVGVMTFTKPVFTATIDYNLKKHSDGKEYFVKTKDTFEYTLEKVDYHLDNLFNGDKTLGEEMNKFLNENWEPVSKELAPVFSESMKGVIVNMLVQFLTQIPFDDIFDQ